MLDIISEHPDFYVIYKPANVSVHQTSEQSGIIPLVQNHLGNPAPLWLVHRLDQVTSGLLVLARSQQAAQTFGHLFSSQQITKYYLAITAGRPKKKQGKIIGDMTKTRNGSWKLLHTKHNPAITEFVSTSLPPGKRLCLIHPLTGKTHQIRVALKSLGAPIVGDLRYYPKNLEPADRCYLHAYVLQFNWQGQQLRFCAPPQEGQCFLASPCQEVLARYSTPWTFF
ncbi:TIGR01621 family pseudouridine synthase [Zooshikella harenae]|uniref:TIGR01621 family pseudouridine synthase n=1 Tax=Zooshikella harenae TaxID=2827238 RepID=A0ABS5ZAG9_9GAMM|nr:TIGR01621 family pseudouridine synthase [Zooshikella harenae]MBU2711056.1 TIGR01621 family pseudouridine synthase [Zooshikella harenae]